MDSLSHFRTIDELVKRLDKERLLLGQMFYKRKTLSLSEEEALDLVNHERERIRYLIDYGVIHESGNFMELESVYLQFFEEVLDVNEEISIASVRECIETLRENINYFQTEKNEQRKYYYQSQIRQLLRKTGLRTLKNVIDLKRNVDTAYKQEPNYEIKKLKLQSLDEKKKSIQSLIDECEKLMDNERVFFTFGADPQMQRTIQDVKNDFNEVSHNLLDIEKQIIVYLNLIEEQNRLFKKIRRLKYLSDQLTITEDTNIQQVLKTIHPLWMENRPYSKMRLSLERLRGSDDMAVLIRKVAQNNGVRKQSRTSASPLTSEDLEEHAVPFDDINPTELWYAFRAGGKDLFAFILGYDYKKKRTIDQHAVLFCQLVVQHTDDCIITDNYATYQNLEYPIVYAK